MEWPDLWKAVVLGLVEGATEFIPVSSTGHLIVASEWLGFVGERAKTFNIFIQLGAILAVVWLYRSTFWNAFVRWRTDPAARRLLINLGLGFLPAAAIGFLLHDWIKLYLFRLEVVAVTLVLGGFGILAIERWHRDAVVPEVDDLPPRLALGVGVAQVLALVPGVSRSGATIMGGLGIGLSRRAATEFSFFLAVPVMIAATMFELFESRQLLSSDDVLVFLVGFIVSFMAALAVVKGLIRYVAGNTVRPFAWYRIALGLLLLALAL
ncbi:MAG: undecaprenyl-diphosphate phosphatase [Longimicrobiales bacterium]